MSGEEEQVLTQRKPGSVEEENITPSNEEEKPKGAQESRVGRFLRGLADSMPEGVKNAMHSLAPVADAIHRGFVIAWPYIITGYRRCKAVYDQMPQYSVIMIYGLIVAFCGCSFCCTCCCY